MDAEFWHQRWELNEIGFHRTDTNPLLVNHFHALELQKGSRVFLPLCGKTLDIAWLLANGYRVAGIEVSEIAIEQLISDLGIDPAISGQDNVKHYRAENIDIFAGDIFDLSRAMLGEVDAVYDRAALVALPEDVRKLYTEHLVQITDSAPQMLITIDYDPAQIEGPPFLVSNEEVVRHYHDRYKLIQVASVELPEKLKGQCTANEHLWLLTPTGH